MNFVSKVFARSTTECVARFAAALPPDVRRGSASLEGWREKHGAMPLVRALPYRWAKGPNQGLSPSLSNDAYGEAEPRLISGGAAAVNEALGAAAKSLEAKGT